MNDDDEMFRNFHLTHDTSSLWAEADDYAPSHIMFKPSTSFESSMLRNIESRKVMMSEVDDVHFSGDDEEDWYGPKRPSDQRFTQAELGRLVNMAKMYREDQSSIWDAIKTESIRMNRSQCQIVTKVHECN